VNIPSRLSQPSFERFRTIISNAANVGRTVEVTAAGLASSTFAARLRDALLSYRKFHWGDESARPDWCRLSVYTNTQGKVFLGSTPPRDENLGGYSVVPTITTETTSRSSWSTAELQAICLLISNKKIAGGVEVPRIPAELSSTLELDYDIAITHEPNASIIF
jgi:hypothetical protein